MKNDRVSELNSIFQSMKEEFFTFNTPSTASNEIASIYHFLPLDDEEINELLSNQFLALESRFAVLNKNREFDRLLTIAQYLFIDKFSNNFNNDIEYKNAAIRQCLHFIVDASYSSQDYHRCILYGEKLLNEIENNSNFPFDPDKKDVLIALSMAHGKISQFDKSDYYKYLIQKNNETIINKHENNVINKIKNIDSDNELFLYRGIVDNIKLGSKIEDIIQMLGMPEKRKDYERMEEMPQSIYLKYHSRGIELLFEEGFLSNIWLKSGRSYGNDENELLFTKYKFSPECNVSLDSKIEDIESIYGKAVKEINYNNNNKIPYRIYRYNGFAIIVIIKSGEIATIRLML